MSRCYPGAYRRFVLSKDRSRDRENRGLGIVGLMVGLRSSLRDWRGIRAPPLEVRLVIDAGKM